MSKSGPLDRRRSFLPHLLLLSAAAGAVGLAIDFPPLAAGVRGPSMAAPYAIAGGLLVAAAWVLGIDPPRGRLLAIGGAILLASWVVAIGYGPTEVAARATAVLGAAAAFSALLGMTPRWAVVAVAVLVGAAAPLLYMLFVHPPFGLLAIYAVAGVGVSAAALSLLPRAARRWPLAVLASLAVVAWLAGAILLLFAYGPPMVAT